ncbi:MAG: hypothetical protein EHM42_12345, partial [Planctomycetaceae bacterium]
MISLAQSLKLLKQVSLRLDLASLGRRFYRLSFWGVIAYAGLLLASRLSGFGAEWFNPWSLAAVPALCALVATVAHRRPTPVDAARAVDLYSGTKDLFLTVALLEKSAGDYQPLVAQAAETQAPRIQPARVVPFQFQKPLGELAAIAALAAAAVLFLPQFDPFGRVEASQQVAKKQQMLEDSKKATEARKAQLKTDVEEGEMSEEAKKAIEGLKTALNKMRPQEKTNNQRELAGQQKNLGEMWRRLNNEKLKELFSHSPQEQQFGSANKEKLEKWTRELQEGSSAALQKEIEEAIEDLQRLEQTTDPVKKAELEQKIRKKLKDLNQFAGDRVGSKPLSAALQRAMQQLEMSRMEGMDPKEAAQAVKESLELSKAELQEIAQSAKDLQKLEESLKIMQMAKQLNEQEKLDGEETEGMGDMGEYEEFYQELIAQLGLSGMEGEGEGEGEGEDGEGEGDGEGMGGRGMGRGRAAPEDDSTESDFRTEQSKSPVTAGKTLMTMKSKGLSQKGDDRAEYRKA